MKTFIIVLGFAILIHGSGCAPIYGRPQMTLGAYGDPALSMQMQASASAELPVGARGQISHEGGSIYYNTAYTRPEVTMAAYQADAQWYAGSAVPATQGVAVATPAATVDPSLQARLEALEDQVAADHLPQ